MSKDPMVIITAFIKPNMEGHVVKALHDLTEFPGFTLSCVRGQGRGRGAGGHFRATEYNFSYQEHLRIELVCRIELVDEICNVIARAAWTGSKGDGVIFSQPLADFFRIREHGRKGGASR
ncbi:MAG: P-II family nitrogen regulator [Pseudomonadota bacterium]